MSLVKAKIGEAIYDVVDYEEYYRNMHMYPVQYTAIRGADGYVYPIRSLSDHRPGAYMTGGLDIFKPPVTATECAMYSEQNIIDFTKAEGMRDLITCSQMLSSAERSILTNIDNLFIPDIGESDTPEMQALKQAIIAKHIDLDKYESRFGPNYNNDKRLLRKDRITFDKFRTIGECLDIKATLIIEDAGPDVPNPIGRPISIEITGKPMSMEGEGEGDVQE